MKYKSEDKVEFYTLKCKCVGRTSWGGRNVSTYKFVIAKGEQTQIPYNLIKALLGEGIMSCVNLKLAETPSGIAIKLVG